MGEKVVIWRLDDGGAHARGQFSCSLCEWGGMFYKNAAQHHAKKVHGGKGTLQRRSLPNKDNEEVEVSAVVWPKSILLYWCPWN